MVISDNYQLIESCCHGNETGGSTASVGIAENILGMIFFGEFQDD